MATSLITFTAQNNNGVAKDAIRFQLVWNQGSMSATSLEAHWTEFLNTVHTGQTHKLGEYLAGCISRTTPQVMAAYDITSHLDGSPHGSPYVTVSDTVLPAALGDSRGNAQCAVLSWNSSDYTVTPVTGPTGAIPTPESAQDMGAPSTHPGVTRLRQRRSNRMFFGPVEGGAIGVNGDGNAQWTDTFMTDVSANLAGFLADAGSNIWQGWSRRNADVWSVVEGWVDRGIKIRRHKGFDPNERTTWT